MEHNLFTWLEVFRNCLSIWRVEFKFLIIILPSSKCSLSEQRNTNFTFLASLLSKHFLACLLLTSRYLETFVTNFANKSTCGAGAETSIKLSPFFEVANICLCKYAPVIWHFAPLQLSQLIIHNLFRLNLNFQAVAKFRRYFTNWWYLSFLSRSELHHF